MSLEIIDDEIKRKFASGSGVGGKSVHEFSGGILLFPHLEHTEEDSEGKTHTTREMNVEARTEYPSPSSSTALKYYGAYYLEHEYGKGRGEGMVTVHDYYSVLMISKGRQSRKEYTIVAGASALNPDNSKGIDLKKVQEQ